MEGCDAVSGARSFFPLLLNGASTGQSGTVELQSARSSETADGRRQTVDGKR